MPPFVAELAYVFEDRRGRVLESQEGLLGGLALGRHDVSRLDFLDAVLLAPEAQRGAPEQMLNTCPRAPIAHRELVLFVLGHIDERTHRPEVALQVLLRQARVQRLQQLVKVGVCVTGKLAGVPIRHVLLLLSQRCRRWQAELRARIQRPTFVARHAMKLPGLFVMCWSGTGKTIMILKIYLINSFQFKTQTD